MPSEISIFAADLIAVLFTLVQVVFLAFILGILTTVAWRGARVLNNWFTLKDYANAYDRGLWENRSQKTGVPLIWDAKSADWREELETELQEQQAKKK